LRSDNPKRAENSGRAVVSRDVNRGD